MSETVYYDQDDVLISDTRLVANDRTYLLSQLASVGSGRKPVGCVPWLLGLLGAMIIAGGLMFAGVYAVIGAGVGEGGLVVAIIFGGIGLLGGLVGVGILMSGVRMAKKRKHTYVVQVTTATGENVSLENDVEDKAREVERALNQALAERR